jgi:hypothetical protein
LQAVRRGIMAARAAFAAALQVHGRHHVLAQLMGLARRQHGRQLADGGGRLGQAAAHASRERAITANRAGP